MPLSIPEALPSFNGVSAGQKATLNVPLGPTYNSITLEYKESGTLANQATLEAGIEEVVLLINGVPRRRLSAQDIIDLNAYYGYGFDDGFLTLHFREMNNAFIDDQEVLALGTSDLQSVTLEVKIASGATSPSLRALADLTRIRQPLGLFKTQLKNVVSVAATGITQYQVPILGPVVAFHARSSDIDDIRAEIDGNVVYEATAASNVNRISNNYPDKNPVTGLFHIDFSPTGRIIGGRSDKGVELGDVLPMSRRINGSLVNVQDFPIEFNMSAATNFQLIAERLERFG